MKSLNVLVIDQKLMFCVISHRKEYGPFFCWEHWTSQHTSTCLKTDLSLIYKKKWTNYIFQQDGAPPNWYRNVRAYLIHILPLRWIGWSGKDDLVWTLSHLGHRISRHVTFSYKLTLKTLSIYHLFQIMLMSWKIELLLQFNLLQWLSSQKCDVNLIKYWI